MQKGDKVKILAKDTIFSQNSTGIVTNINKNLITVHQIDRRGVLQRRHFYLQDLEII